MTGAHQDRPQGASDDPGHPAVLTLRGDIDFFTEDSFRLQAERLLDDPAATSLVVDLAQVTAIDSSGIGLLVDLLRLCRDMELPMSLRATPPHVVRLLDLTGLDQIITVE